MSILIASLIGMGAGVGLLLAGLYIGINFNVHKYLKKQEEKEKQKAIKNRKPAEYVPMMSDQEAKENDENSIERINNEVV